MGSQPAPSQPKPVNPKIYQTVIPLESYKMAADYMNELKRQTNDVWGRLTAQAGSPSELAYRQAQTRAQEASSYQASLPHGDKYLQQVTGVSDPYGSARSAAADFSSQARSDYLDAISKRETTWSPPETISTPSWAESTIPKGMPGYKQDQTSKPADFNQSPEYRPDRKKDQQSSLFGSQSFS